MHAVAGVSFLCFYLEEFANLSHAKKKGNQLFSSTDARSAGSRLHQEPCFLVQIPPGTTKPFIPSGRRNGSRLVLERKTLRIVGSPLTLRWIDQICHSSSPRTFKYNRDHLFQTESTFVKSTTNKFLSRVNDILFYCIIDFQWMNYWVALEKNTLHFMQTTEAMAFSNFWEANFFCIILC